MGEKGLRESEALWVVGTPESWWSWDTWPLAFSMRAWWFQICSPSRTKLETIHCNVLYSSLIYSRLKWRDVQLSISRQGTSPKKCKQRVSSSFENNNKRSSMERNKNIHNRPECLWDWNPARHRGAFSSLWYPAVDGKEKALTILRWQLAICCSLKSACQRGWTLAYRIKPTPTLSAFTLTCNGLAWSNPTKIWKSSKVKSSREFASSCIDLGLPVAKVETLLRKRI